MIDIEKVKEFKRQKDLIGFWSSEAFEYFSEHIEEIDQDQGIHRIIFPYLSEINDMFKDLDLEEELS